MSLFAHICKSAYSNKARSLNITFVMAICCLICNFAPPSLCIPASLHELQEAAIEDYFKPIDKNAEIIMNMQIEKEEKQMQEMLKTMQEQAMIQKEMAEKKNTISKSNQAPEIASTPSNLEKSN